MWNNCIKSRPVQNNKSPRKELIAEEFEIQKRESHMYISSQGILRVNMLKDNCEGIFFGLTSNSNEELCIAKKGLN